MVLLKSFFFLFSKLWFWHRKLHRVGGLLLVEAPIHEDVISFFRSIVAEIYGEFVL